MKGFTAKQVIRALDADVAEASGQVRRAIAQRLEVPAEIFVSISGYSSFWLRQDGSRVSGWLWASEHSARTFGRWDAFWIRRAVRRWLRRREGYR